MLVGIYEKDCYIFHLKTYCSLLDNAPNYLVGCVIQKRYKFMSLIDHVHKDFYSALTNFIIKGLYCFYSIVLCF